MRQDVPDAYTTGYIRPACLTALTGALALAGVAAAAQGAPHPAQSATVEPSPLYCVTNLGPGSLGALINAKGQVAFSHVDPIDGGPLRVRAWFYDGLRLHSIDTLGGNSVRPTGLNDAGQVTGGSTTASGSIHAFVWSLSHGIKDIGTLPGSDYALEPVINNRGEVAGTSGAPNPHAFVWNSRTGIKNLGVLVEGESSASYGRGINDAGMVAGDAWAGGHDYHAFIWSRNRGMVDIDTLGNSYSTPVAIGAHGEVAGNSMNPPNNYGRIFWWTRATGMRDLGTANGESTWMTGMSSGGRVVGIINYPDSSQHGLTWTARRGMRDLGTLGGLTSAAMGANNKGQVVGGSRTFDNRYHAFVWTEKDGLIDLNKRLYRAPAGLELESADAISDNGSIVASSNAGLVLLRPAQSCKCMHTAGPVSAPDIVQPGAPVGTSMGLTTDNSGSRYDVVWAWGDGTADRAQRVLAKGGSGSAIARHIYSAPGIYTITAVVKDQTGNSISVARPIVVAELSSGTIARTGTVVLPIATGQGLRAMGGKARFAFVTSGKTKTDGAKGLGHFFFSLPGFVFKSNDAQHDAQVGAHTSLVGTGKVNGTGNYRFTVTVAASNAASGTAESFRMKIWHINSKTSVPVIDYDSDPATSRLSEAR